MAIIENNIDINHCITSKLQVSKLQREKPDQLYLVLCILIEELIFALNVPVLTESQVNYIVSALISKYWFYKVEDFIACFRNAKQAQYGNIYNRIDIHVIFTWLAKYDQERTQAIEQLRILENQNFKKEIFDNSLEVWNYDKEKQKYLSRQKDYDSMSEEERKNFRIAQKKKLFGL